MSAVLDPLTPLDRELLIGAAILAGAAALALVVQGILFWLLHRFASRNDGILTLVVARATAPSRFIFPLVAIESVLPAVPLPAAGKAIAEHALGITIIAAIVWALIALAQLVGDLAKRPYQFDEEDNLHARQVATRVDLLTRAAVTIILFVGVAVALTTFPAIRAVGATLLASAGLIGLMAGFAARPIFENLVAGIQIALTQPIRIDDALFLDGEFGHVEKIESTYVVVRLWDLRRKIFPLTYFINTPFQNWTYTAANLTGSVLIYVEQSTDIAAFRSKAIEAIGSSPLSDGRVASVDVTDTRDNFAVELRVLCSARNASQLFDLRCFVREQMIAYLASMKKVEAANGASG